MRPEQEDSCSRLSTATMEYIHVLEFLDQLLSEKISEFCVDQELNKKLEKTEDFRLQFCSAEEARH